MAAIKKHGVDNFIRTTLATCETQAELNEMEAFYVDEDFVERQDTYNLVTGGGGSGIPGTDTKNKMSAAQKGNTNGVVWTDEMREKKSAAMKDKPKSEAHKAAISAAMKDKPKSEAQKAAISAAMNRPEMREKISSATSASMTQARRGLQSANQKKVEAKKRQAEQADQEKYKSSIF